MNEKKLAFKLFYNLCTIGNWVIFQSLITFIYYLVMEIKMFQWYKYSLEKVFIRFVWIIFLSFSFCNEKINPKIFFFLNLSPKSSTTPNSSSFPSPLFSIGGTVSGLTGSGLVIQNNGSETLNLTSNGVFTFSRNQNSNSTYAVTVITNPSSPTQSCSISNGTGTISNSNISNINLVCTIINAPTGLIYSTANYILRQNVAINSILPTLLGSISSCTATPSLPSGLSINNSTCEISGTPSSVQALINYTISANNLAGNSTTNINISVQTGIYRIFITSSNYNGNLIAAGGGANGAIAADNLCNMDTNKPNTSNYKAMILETTNRRALTLINWILLPNTTYIRSSDSVTIFTTNGASIFTFGLLTNSYGSGPLEEYWTGFQFAGIDWDLSTQRCTDWSSTATTARYGRSNAVSYDSLAFGTSSSCAALKKLLCVEQ